ncbi:DUF4129 domain-containing transglutaminase family protein [Sporosarcina highlanderae]|uniref:DUF4129 domain-containing transglutaminase family protein n=1 Tax=Sporosarcina highlanderae TaxID=3035916 RepID=A0ABT8JVL5_9BACL|nr:DUF4129 domain-containing transglutaminase family protein [Sporosarcina highlanderae]MDN4609216.1 DUF4129 domain-containing transglutaminase family protein [Sporosarcina highlanderae]
MKEGKTDIRFLILMYALAFVLLWEWLLPVIELTDTEYIGVFLWFIGLSFLFRLTGMKWWLSVPLKIIYLFWSLHFVFYHAAFLTKDSVGHLVRDLISNFAIVGAGDWQNITNPMRTVLFFILLWMTIYLIRHWIEVRKSILLFYAMTVIFISVLDTFSSYVAEAAIFRIMVTGLLLVGLLTISRLSEKHSERLNTGMFATFSVPLLFAVIVSSTFASFMPEKGPVWADPIPFLKSAVLGEGSGTGGVVSKSGYDFDDSRLGGAFSKDNTLIFTATVPRKQYWKIETKNTYTSKGWEQRIDENPPVTYVPGAILEEVDYSDTANNLHAEINMRERLPYLVYPYGTSTIHARTDVLLKKQEETGQLWAMKDGESFDLDSFSVDFTEQSYSLKELREVTMEDYHSDPDVPELSEYLQLPEQLPDRVRELAMDITSKEESIYEKAKSIERYFSRSGFSYDQQNVAIPRGNEDYVDQFLFDTKRGYCDNFSTSMVVMLRSVDIPARWAKGFAPGEGKANSNGKVEYKITNNEAHSWVEVYIPGFGWMPFEPTIGFSNPVGIQYDLEMDISDPETPNMEERERPEPKKDETPVAKVKDGGGFGPFLKSVGDFLQKHAWIGILGIALLLFAVWLVYRNRGKWVPKLLIKSHRKRKPDWIRFTKQYKSLLKQLERFGILRTDSMTLSEYAKSVDTYFGGRQMGKLTEVYEQGLYGGYTNRQDWASLQEIWEDLIIRATG